MARKEVFLVLSTTISKLVTEVELNMRSGSYSTNDWFQTDSPKVDYDDSVDDFNTYEEALAFVQESDHSGDLIIKKVFRRIEE